MGVINLGLLVDKIKRKLENAGFIKNTDYASATKAGVVKVGDGLAITDAGVLSASGGSSGGFIFDEILDNSSGTGTGTMNFTFPEGKTAADYKFLMVITKSGTDYAHANILTEVLNASTACRVNAQFSGGSFLVANVKTVSIAMDSNSGSMSIYKVFAIA